jgi:hypothetical protein
MPPFNPEKPEDLKQKASEILTILPHATIETIEEACSREAYTHVHILAHGMEDKNQPGSPYGVALYSRHGKEKIDVVSGSRLATALRPLRQDKEYADEKVKFPAVVTVASCESGHVSSVTHNNGASFAHDLHQSGIPFVVASQFPLSFAGSIHMTEVLYDKVLWGEDPRIALHQLRGKLYALHASDTHDWASLVAYAALPDDLEVQLEDVRYSQAREAINTAMKHIDGSIDKMRPNEDFHDRNNATPLKKGMTMEHLEKLFSQVETAARRLPTSGRYETEGTGLLASTEKRMAEARHRASFLMGDSERQTYREKSFQGLRLALRYYEEAFHNKMIKSTWSAPNRNVLHWVLCQCLSLRAVLGEEFDRDKWATAVVSAQIDLDIENPETRAWAHSTLGELYLLLLAYPESKLPVGYQKARDKAREHISKLNAIRGDSFEVYATRRQLQRYMDWWGSAEFESCLQRSHVMREGDWAEAGGIKDLAGQFVNVLSRGF